MHQTIPSATPEVAGWLGQEEGIVGNIHGSDAREQTYGGPEAEGSDMDTNMRQVCHHKIMRKTPSEIPMSGNREGGKVRREEDGEQDAQKEIKDEKISEKDVNNWASEAETIDKYKQRFKEEWKSKLSEAVEKMLRDLQS